jgi:hypothetical protein
MRHDEPGMGETAESLVLAEIRARHVECIRGSYPGAFAADNWCPRCGEDWPCDTAVALAAYDERARAFAELAQQVRK